MSTYYVPSHDPSTVGTLRKETCPLNLPCKLGLRAGKAGNNCSQPPSQGGLEAPSEEAALKTSRWENRGTGIGSRKSWVPGSSAGTEKGGTLSGPQPSVSCAGDRISGTPPSFSSPRPLPLVGKGILSSLFLCLSKCSPGLP